MPSTSPAPIVAASTPAMRSAFGSPRSASQRDAVARISSGGASSARPRMECAIARSGQYVSRWPYGRHCAIATDAVSSRAGSRAMNSSRSRLLPTPGAARTLTRNGRRSSNARFAVSSSCARSPCRPTSGTRGRDSWPCPMSRRHATGAALPLASIDRGLSNSKPCAARAVRSPTRIAHGSAACWSRAATFTASPVTSESAAVWSRAATTSPDCRPSRIGRRSPSWASSRTRSRISRAADRARPASSSCATGSPNTAMTASPMNFSSVPPWAATTSRAIA